MDGMVGRVEVVEPRDVPGRQRGTQRPKGWLPGGVAPRRDVAGTLPRGLVAHPPRDGRRHLQAVHPHRPAVYRQYAAMGTGADRLVSLVPTGVDVLMPVGQALVHVALPVRLASMAAVVREHAPDARMEARGHAAALDARHTKRAHDRLREVIPHVHCDGIDTARKPGWYQTMS